MMYSLIKHRHHIVIKYGVIVLLTLLVGCAGGGSLRKSEKKPEEIKKDIPRVEHVDKNKVLGRKFLEAARAEYGFVNDHEVVSLVNQVGKEIVEAIGDDPDTYHFIVLRKNRINAFAIPGGYIFIFDGLLRRVNSVDELAGVLAHEIGHVKRDHFFKNARKIGAMNLATMAAVILAGLAGGNEAAVSTVAQAANVSLQLKYSRENEDEADFFAIKALQRTQYNPSGLSDFFKTLAFYQRTSPRDIIPPYLSTHPGINERLLKVEAIVGGSEERKSYKKRVDWDRIVTIVEAAGEKTNKESEEEDRKSLGEEKGHYLRGVMALKKGSYKEALNEYQGAVKLNPDNPLYHADMALIYLRLKMIALAKKEAMKSLQISVDHAMPYIVSGMVAHAEGRYEESIEFFKKARRLAPYDPMIHYDMARSYHALSMPVKERFQLGRYFRLSYDTQRALWQFRKALSLIKEGESPVLHQKILEEIRGIMREGV